MFLSSKSRLSIYGIVCALFLFLNNCEIQKQRTVKFELHETGSFGQEKLPNSSNDTLPAGGETFSNITDIALSKDGKLYVLDAGLKKIVAFNKKNNLENVILGGQGKGPGEFQLPTALVVDSKNRIWVYDYALQRASIFSSGGQFQRTFSLPVRSKSVVLTKDRIWMTILSSREYYAAYVEKSEFDETIQTVESALNYMLPISQEQLKSAPHGVLSWIGLSNSGSVLIAKEVPGLWFAKVNGKFEQRGKKLVSDAQPHQAGGRWVVPAQTKGISGFGKNRISIIWVQKETENLPTEHVATWMDIFSEEGEHIGSAEIPFEDVDAFTVDKEGNFLYIAVDEPFPRVVQYRITNIES